MKAAEIPLNDQERLHALREPFCAYAPREDRFDRITRTLQRVLQVPIALVSIVEEDEQWFRSVQGLDVAHTPRDISFCGHAVAHGQPLIINDTWEHPDFADNPLVIGAPGIRSYVGWPLEIAPKMFAGTLCAIDTIPRVFDDGEMGAIHDLARMAETELRVSAATSVQKSLLMSLDLAQRRNAIETVTGCWTTRAFRRLLDLAVAQARVDRIEVAVNRLRVSGLGDASRALVASGSRDLPLAILAQLLRARMPREAALTHLSDGQFFALYTAPSAWHLQQALASDDETTLNAIMPNGARLQFELDSQVFRLRDFDPQTSAGTFWATCLMALATPDDPI